MLDGVVRIDPFEAGDAYAGQASFRRTAGGKGITLQLASAPASYLRHDEGRLAVGAGSGARSAFVLS